MSKHPGLPRVCLTFLSRASSRGTGLVQVWLTHFFRELRFAGRMEAMPKRFPREFKRHVVAVARRRTVPLEEVAADFDISLSSLHRWMRPAEARVYFV